MRPRRSCPIVPANRSRRPNRSSRPGGPASPADGGMADEGGEESIPSQVRLTSEPGDPVGNVPTVNPVSPGQTAVPSSTVPSTELPHWTEPPTGQVPAVLAHDGGDDPSGSAIRTPSWREEDADWLAHDEEFEPSMFGHDDVALGSLDETDSTDAERRPWEFDLDSPPPVAAGSGRSLELTPTRGRRGRIGHHRSDHRAGAQVVPVASRRASGWGPDDAEVARAGEGGARRARRPDQRRNRGGGGTRAGGHPRRQGCGRDPRAPIPSVPTTPRPARRLFESVKSRPTGTAAGRPCPAQRVAAGPDAGQAARRHRHHGRAHPWRPSRPGPRSPTFPAPVASGAAWPDWPPPTGVRSGTVISSGARRSVRWGPRSPVPPRRASTSPPPRRPRPGCPAAGPEAAFGRTRPPRWKAPPVPRGPPGVVRLAPPTQATGARVRHGGRRKGGARSGSGSAPASPSPWSPWWPSSWAPSPPWCSAWSWSPSPPASASVCCGVPATTRPRCWVWSGPSR